MFEGVSKATEEKVVEEEKKEDDVLVEAGDGKIMKITEEKSE